MTPPEQCLPLVLSKGELEAPSQHSHSKAIVSPERRSDGLRERLAGRSVPPAGAGAHRRGDVSASSIDRVIDRDCTVMQKVLATARTDQKAAAERDGVSDFSRRHLLSSVCWP